MEENKVNKRKVPKIIVLLLILTVTFVGLGIYAWARYISMEVSPSTAPIAKWHFEIKNALTGQSIETSPIDLVTTEYNHVAEHKIAPGTEGEFEVILDSEGTEVDLTYDLQFSLTNCPRNMIFSRVNEDTTKTVLSDKSESTTRTFNIRKYLTKEEADTSVNERKDLHKVKIHWIWPYETNEIWWTNPSADEIEAGAISANDDIDTQDAGKTINMVISLTANQVIEAPIVSLSDATIKYRNTENVESVITNGGTIKLAPGDTAQISLDTHNAGKLGTLTYSSGNDAVASVSSTGLITAVAVGNTTITISDGTDIVTFNVKVSVPAPLASEKLQVNSSATLAEEKSPYVNYVDGNGNTILCRVLYNDPTHGLQIISDNSVETVTLGEGDPNYTTGTNKEKTQNSYNNAIENLNKKAESYINSTYVDSEKKNARCVGSIATVTNGAFENKNNESGTFTGGYDFLTTYDVNGHHKDTDTNYEEDYNQLGNLGIRALDPPYWVASRYVVSKDRYDCYFYVRLLGRRGELYSDNLWYIHNNGAVITHTPKDGFRPVFLLKPNVTVIGGTGTAIDPYILGVE